jgi:hypothetical protein
MLNFTWLDLIDIENTEPAHWCGLPALFWLSCYVAIRHLAMAPQSSAEDLFLLYCLLHNFQFKL